MRRHVLPFASILAALAACAEGSGPGAVDSGVAGEDGSPRADAGPGTPDGAPRPDAASSTPDAAPANVDTCAGALDITAAAQLVAGTDEISAGITRLLESETERAKLARYGRARAEKYRWERCAEESLRFFHRVAGQERGR